VAAGVIDLDISEPQGQFLSLDRRFRGYVGGFGSGKTFVGCVGLGLSAYKFPGIPQGYFAPTYPQIRDIFYPTMEEVAERMGLTCLIKQGDHEVHLLDRGRLRSKIICRSMEHPERIVGFKIGRALVDELDVLPLLKAQQAWRKIIARMRWDGPDGFRTEVDVTTTPEGFQFMHLQFVRKLREKPELARLYGLVQASTYENEQNLPEGYIESLRESYPDQLVRAYLHGEFVNLLHGTVYSHYDRQRNRCADFVQENEPISIGMDFNINKMAGIVHVVRDGEPRAVAELVNLRDTPAMVEAIKQKYWKYDKSRGDWDRARTITIHPDASGESGSTKDASKSDLALLRAAGFRVIAPAANPPVRDRILSMNMAFCDNSQRVKYRVNDDLCPVYSENLEQQAYDDYGQPDKKSGHDHTNDAGGYFIYSRFPIIKPASSLSLGRAH
jgi:hypothetical protein